MSQTILSPATATKERRRRIRISLSPRKKSARKTRPSDPYPLPSPKLVLPSTSYTIEDCDLELDFSFWDDHNACFKPIETRELNDLIYALMNRYPQAESVFVSVPFCVVECMKEIPPESEQCFLAAGLVVVFHLIGEPYPFGVNFIGYRGSADAPHLPDDVERDLVPCHLPKLSSLEFIFNHVPSAIHVSTYPFQLLFELEETDISSFDSQLENLPERFGSLNVGYNNGPLLLKRHARAIVPNPTKIDGTYDTTNYLLPENGGKLRPGILLESVFSKRQEDGKSREVVLYSNSGVKISRQDEVRFTVASHGWDSAEDKTIYHGGQNVGKWERCVGEDIGLAEAEYDFSNEFLDLRITAKKLLRSSLLTFGQFVVIDSAYTGRQRMFYSGIRAGPKHPVLPPDAKEPYYGPSLQYRYLQIEQGIYAVRSEVINGEPKIREGVCGTPVVLQGRSKRDESFLIDGQVCGFMLWNDVKGYANDGRLYCYCQPVDPLIEEGWEVVN